MSTQSPGRLAAVDWMRGIVMLLMAVDHAAAILTTERLAADSAYLLGSESHFVPGMELPLDAFFTRWITHLCAPTFLFLTGTSLALSIERRRASGAGERELDRHLGIRGLVLIGFEVTYLSLAGPQQTAIMLQVLYAIGLGMILMIAARRLPTGVLVGLALGWLLGGELVTGAIAPPGEGFGLWVALFVAPIEAGPVTVLYPVIPWLAMLMLGWGFGRGILAGRPPGMLAALGGLSGLLVFAIVRGWNDYGNMFVLRYDGSLAHWLHASKYPPSLSFTALELGIMGLALAALIALERRVPNPRAGNPLLVFGQTALFFYLLHFAVLVVFGLATGLLGSGSLVFAYVGAAIASVVLYPACVWYRGYKRAHPTSLAQYV